MTRPFGTVVAGGGPAGLAPLIAASREGLLDRLPETGVATVERRRSLGSGRSGDSLIRPNGAAGTFQACLDRTRHAALQAVRGGGAARARAPHGGEAVRLTMVARFLAAVGRAVRSIVAGSRRGLFGTRVARGMAERAQEPSDRQDRRSGRGRSAPRWGAAG